MLAKLIPVAGNVCESDIGIESNLAAEIAQVVNVIVNSSANTTFDERFLFYQIYVFTLYIPMSYCHVIFNYLLCILYISLGG